MNPDAIPSLAGLGRARDPLAHELAFAPRPAAPSTYPTHLVRLWQSRTGRPVLIRPVARGDRDTLEAFVRALSPASRANRFFGGLASLSSEALDCATQIDYVQHMALLALVLDGGRERQVGAGRYVGTGVPGRCDFALVVADDWQRHGIGTELLSALMSIADAHGFESIGGDVLATNTKMLNLARKLGFQVKSIPREPTLRRVSRAPGMR
jgi:acetyltransferase